MVSILTDKKEKQYVSDNAQLMTEWDWEKNISVSPEETKLGSEKRIWWICPKGHSWNTTVATRVRGCNCPTCSKEYKTSIPEQAIFYYCQKYFPDSINSYKTEWLQKSEIDIYIPSLGLGIEYDGRAWHKNIEKDVAKNALCLMHGITLFHIREPGLPRIKDNYIELKSLKYEDLTPGIISLFNIIAPTINCDIDVIRDLTDIYGLLHFKSKEESLSNKYPHLVAEWDYTKNGRYLTPDNINCKSGKNVYWLCPKGHSYQARVDHRTLKQSGCPYCAGKKVIVGETDLASRFPHIAAEWDYSQNEKNPDDYYHNSSQKVWWKCSEGHTWQATIKQRVRTGSGCPYCAGQKAIPGQTDIQTVDPILISEWDYDKNTEVDPENLLPYSRVKVWWKCNHGHSWCETVRNRYISKKRLCPICHPRKKRQ